MSSRLADELGGAWREPPRGGAAPPPPAGRDEDLFVRITDLLEELDEQVSNAVPDASAAQGPEGRLLGGGLLGWLSAVSGRGQRKPPRQAQDRCSDAGSAAGSENESAEDELGGQATPRAPTLAGWELEGALKKLRRQERLDAKVAERIILGVHGIYASQRSLVNLDLAENGGRLVVVGDLHGHLKDLLHILEEHGDPRDGTVYLFNGDFVDRGEWGPEVLLYLYCLKLQSPRAVHLNRGNHEDMAQNRVGTNGFRDVHCPRAWPAPSCDHDHLYRLCRQSFKQLPLCHVIGGEILVVHGGLPLDEDVTLQDIAAIDRKHRIPAHRTIIHGYPVGQRVRAKRALRGVSQGTPGELVQKIPRSDGALVRFKGHARCVRATIAGAPEREQDLEICYSCEEERRRSRSDRIFTALMWSDPCPSAAASSGPPRGLSCPCASSFGAPRPPRGLARSGPNTARNIGFVFDSGVTERFLTANGLRLLVRSHQKAPGGVREDQRARDAATGELLTVTVFSASNYPCGSGQPLGNRAGVLVFTRPGVSSLHRPPPWRELYGSVQLWRRPASDLRAHADSAAEQGARMRERALQQLWLLIYCARPDILAHFQDPKVDAEETGTADLNAWVEAMRACVIADEEFPWREVAPHLVSYDKQLRFSYPAFLARYTNKLSSRLEERWCQELLRTIGSRVVSEWDRLDASGTGQLSYSEVRRLLTELCPSLRNRDGAGFSRDLSDDMAYAVLAALDRDRSGFVQREELLQAVAGATALAPRAVPEAAVEKCWASLQAVLRVLSNVPSRDVRRSLFRCLDTDGNGKVTWSEFREGLKRLLLHSGLDSSVDEWGPLLWLLTDTDGSGSISPAELEEALEVRDRGAQSEREGALEARGARGGAAGRGGEAARSSGSEGSGSGSGSDSSEEGSGSSAGSLRSGEGGGRRPCCKRRGCC